VANLRDGLKVMRRAQQDVEYLLLLAKARGWDAARVRSAVAAAFADDPQAPVPAFSQLTLARLTELRERVAATIRQAR